MRIFALIFVGLLLSSAAWIHSVRTPLPPSPIVCAQLSQDVPLTFEINDMTASNVEISLVGMNGKNQTFVRFSMANIWAEGRLGLVMESMKPAPMRAANAYKEKVNMEKFDKNKLNSNQPSSKGMRSMKKKLSKNQSKSKRMSAMKKRLSQNQSNKKDLTVFTKDRAGKAVSKYTFVQSLVEGQDGKMYMKMTYEGPDVPMLEMLQVRESIMIPSHLSHKFLRHKGKLHFVEGQYGFDRNIGGFYLPVEVR